MRIGIDARAAVNNTDGIGRYATELIKALSQRDDPHQYVVFKNTQFDFSFKLDSRFHEIVVPFKRYTLREQILMPKMLEAEKLDVFHSLHFTVPLGYRGVKVITVHDIMPILFPWFFGTRSIIDYIASLYISSLVKRSINRASMIIADSDHTAMDLRRHYSLDPRRLCRIYLGIDHLNQSLPEENNNLGAQLGFTYPFIMTITNFRPYKNTKKLLDAFAMVRKKLPHLQLVIVGNNPKYFKRTIGPSVLSVKDNVHFLGFVDDHILTKLLRTADAFVFPSYYEGFGFPILEAMTLGAPVITSSVASLPEIGGNAVVYINPDDSQDIADAIIKVYLDKEMQSTLREQGKEQSKKFRWQNTAAQTLCVYEKALN
jgi:glycosyltransferase involved in cell wall biosynthesis